MAPALCLIDLDGTLREGRTITHLATRFGVADAVERAMSTRDGPHASHAESERVMACFAGIPAADFAAACAELPCRDDARTFVAGLQERGFRVGIVTASYAPAATAAQAATGADLVAAIEPQIEKGRLTGRLHDSDWEGDCGHMVCKERVLDTWRRAQDADFTLAVGNAGNDVCMFEAADLAVAIDPSTPEAVAAAHHVVPRLADILPFVDAQRGGNRPSPAAASAEPPRH